METRSNQVLVGSITLGLLAALVVFVVWLSQFGGGGDKRYDIFFTQSVDGLAKGSSVTFSGVPVGQIESINLVPQSPQFVRVRINVNSNTPVLEGSMDTESSFAGNGASKQSNALDGAISVTVAKRFPNGNLLVRGQKWININTGREFVRVEGIVRPSDIAPDNSVVSWKVADAYISYGGQGTVANAAKPGWLYRFFNSPRTPF